MVIKLYEQISIKKEPIWFFFYVAKAHKLVIISKKKV